MKLIGIMCFIGFFITLIFINGVVSEQTVVIHTAAKNYDEPSLYEYQKCFESNLVCKQNCETANNRTACEAECPICPILINEQVLVQGVNDTLYQPPKAVTRNTTNIIHVQNDIYNVIKEQTITEDETNILSNLTHPIRHLKYGTGGAFGLGANENGSCCIVLRPSKNCEQDQTSNTLRCHTKRRLACGDKCVARVMYAKSLLHCKKDIDGNEDCSRSLEYVPFEEKTYDTVEPKCYYVPQWPYVSCIKERPSADICRRCLQLPYGYVLAKGLPPVCIYCLSNSPFAAAFNEFDLFTLRNDDLAFDDKQVPAFEKYYAENNLDEIFDNFKFSNLNAKYDNTRRKRHQHSKK